MIAGWMRIVGHVTAVVTFIRVVACAIAPIVDQTNALWPCSSFHGWKWSEIHRSSKAGFLGHDRLANQLRWSGLLA